MSMKATSILAGGLSLGLTALAPAIAHAGDATPPAPAPAASSSENLHPGIGGHAGIATTLVTTGSEDTTTISDQFTLAFPIGIGFKLTDKAAIDFETVVANPISPKGTTSLTIDPGVVYDIGSVVLGLRVAFAVNGPTNFGLIPLVHKGIADVGHGGTWFVEAAFPTTIALTTTGTGAASEDKTTFAFNVVFHTGIGF